MNEAILKKIVGQVCWSCFVISTIQTWIQLRYIHEQQIKETKETAFSAFLDIHIEFDNSGTRIYNKRDNYNFYLLLLLFTLTAIYKLYPCTFINSYYVQDLTTAPQTLWNVTVSEHTLIESVCCQTTSLTFSLKLHLKVLGH